MRTAVSMQRKLHGGEPHPTCADAINDLGRLLEENGDYAESERMFRESIAQRHRLYGDKHPAIAQGLNLANALQDNGELANAESTYRAGTGDAAGAAGRRASGGCQHLK